MSSCQAGLKIWPISNRFTVYTRRLTRFGLLMYNDQSQVSYSDVGVAIDVEFHPSPNNRGGPILIGPQGQMVHQGLQLGVIAFGEDAEPEPMI